MGDSSMAKRVVISIPEDVLKQVDTEAKKSDKSRSGYLSEMIRSASLGHKSDANVIHRDSDLIQDMKLLEKENENLKLLVKNLETNFEWLRGEYSRLADATIQKALPRPRKSVFSKLMFWKKD